MNGLSFLLGLLYLLSADIFIGFTLYVLYNFFDKKYNSTLEINILKQELEYLKEENKKLNGFSTDFWENN